MIVNSWINTKDDEFNGPKKYNFLSKKYNFLLSNLGFPHVKDIKEWVSEDPDNRQFGNMGYVSCNSEQDAIMIVLRWS